MFRLAKFLSGFLLLTFLGVFTITRWIEPTIGDTYGMLLSVLWGLVIGAHLLIIYETKK